MPAPEKVPVLPPGHPDALVGTWKSPQVGVDIQISFIGDGTWSGSGRVQIAEDQWVDIENEGTWEIRDGAIHNITTMSKPDLGIPLPYTSVEKLVSFTDREYRYVCPIQKCTNKMRRVDEEEIGD